MTSSRAADHAAGGRQRDSEWALRLLNTLCSGTFAERVNLYVAASLMAAGVRPCAFDDAELEYSLVTGRGALTVDQLQVVADRLDVLPEELLAAVAR